MLATGHLFTQPTPVFSWLYGASHNEMYIKISCATPRNIRHYASSKWFNVFWRKFDTWPVNWVWNFVTEIWDAS